MGIDKKIESAFNRFQPNHGTCSGYVSVTGSTPIVAGTGTYAGITGGFTLTLTLALIGPKFGSGKHAGQCNNANSAEPVGQMQIVTGTGTVSY